MRKFALATTSLALMAMASLSLADVVIMDQIGPDYLGQNGQAINASQQFEAAFAIYDVVMIDDFVVPSGLSHISVVEAAMGRWNNANLSFAAITNYRVEIYSSVAAATGNLVGDVASVNVLAADAVLADPWIPGTATAKVLLNVNIPAPAAGTYYIGVIPRCDFGTAGQTGVLNSVWAGNTPGGLNNYQCNPGGGFAIPGNNANRLADCAYRITAEEPSGFTVSGNVDLQDFGGDDSTQSVTIEVRNVGDVTPLETHVVPLDANGNYSFTSNVAAGNYDVACKGSHWLRQTVSNVSFSMDVTVDFSIINGDCDDDNEVTLVDGGIISAAFGKAVGDAGYDARADLDGDEEITLVDYGIYSAKFGQAGDE